MRVEDYTKYIGILHELALIEDDLRAASYSSATATSRALAKRILFERFSVD